MEIDLVSTPIGTPKKFFPDIKKFPPEKLLKASIEILNKPFDQRNSEDIYILANYLRYFGFFSKLLKENGYHVLFDLCKYLKYERYRPNELIFEQGPFNNFYQILKKQNTLHNNTNSGAVSVYIDPNKANRKHPITTDQILKFLQRKDGNHDESDSLNSISQSERSTRLRGSQKLSDRAKDEGQKVIESKESTNKDDAPKIPYYKQKTMMIRIPISRGPSIEFSRQNTKSSATNDKEVGINAAEENDIKLLEVKILKAGESFGEVALLENKPRQATIACKEDAELAVVDKKYYDAILKEFEDKKLQEHIRFFADMKMFYSWPYHHIRKIYLHTVCKEYKRKQIVFQEGEQSTEVYFIKSGEFKLIKEYEFSTPISETNYNDNPNPNMIIDSNKKILKKSVQVCLLTSKEIFGEEEVVENCNRKYTVICASTTGEVYVLKAKDFLNKIYAESNSREYIQLQMKHRQIIHDNRLKITTEMMEKNRNFFSLPKKLLEKSSKSSLSPEKRPLPTTSFILLDANNTSQNININNNSPLDITRAINSAKKAESPSLNGGSECMNSVISEKSSKKLRGKGKLKMTLLQGKSENFTPKFNLLKQINHSNSQSIFESPIKAKSDNKSNWTCINQLDISNSPRPGTSSQIYYEANGNEGQDAENFRLNLCALDSSPEKYAKSSRKSSIINNSLSMPQLKDNKNMTNEGNDVHEIGWIDQEILQNNKQESNHSSVKKNKAININLDSRTKSTYRLGNTKTSHNIRGGIIGHKIRKQYILKNFYSNPYGDQKDINIDEGEYAKVKLEIESEINKKLENTFKLSEYFLKKNVQEKDEDINSEEFQKKTLSISKIDQKEIENLLNTKKYQSDWKCNIDLQKSGINSSKPNLNLEKSYANLFFKNIAEKNENEHLNSSEVTHKGNRPYSSNQSNRKLKYKIEEKNKKSVYLASIFDLKSRSIEPVRKREYRKEIEQIKASMILKRQGKYPAKNDL